MQRNPRKPLTVKLERHPADNMRKPNLGFRSFLENNFLFRSFVKFLAVFGVCMVIADGVPTPAQSVLGAIQGLKAVDPEIETNTIVGISCAILFVLFLIQPFGITKLGTTFAPIVMVWLLFNMAFGIYNLIRYDASILKAFNPVYSFKWFIRNGEEGWKSLGAILLAFTGVEALFADLGAFSARAVRLSWLFFAYPCLLLAYTGQAAYISIKPEAVSNPFFNTVPSGIYYPSLVLSILAAIVASQAMITGSFQLLSQCMSLSYFPKVKLLRTSIKLTFHGQIYIPLANWLMMIGTIIVTAVYNNITSLGNVYGFCVIMVAFITTCMVPVVALLDTEIQASDCESPENTDHSRVKARALRERDTLDAAYEKQVIYILGKEQLRLSMGSILPRKIALSTFIRMRENTRKKQQEFNVPIDQLVEVGYIKEI